jgi:flagellum-specific ATP synthase
VIDLSAYTTRVESAPRIAVEGEVREVLGMLIEVAGLNAAIGDRLEVRMPDRTLALEVLGFKNGRLLASALGPISGVKRGSRVCAVPGGASVEVGDALLGRVIDAFGAPLDGRPAPLCDAHVPLRREPPPAFSRRPITVPIDTGVRVIDTLLPLGRGQRVGLFAGTGVGKSTLLAMLCRRAQADVIVIGLIGERGREVGHFVHDALGAEGLARGVVVAATSDAPPLVRAQGALRATAIAEYFRDKGKNVLLLIDSVTRYAMALREATLASGEPPVNKGYTPSVFAALPTLFERAGNCSGEGSITSIYTVLFEGDDASDPIADAVRGALDGHIVLSRKIAERGQFPAVDLLPSVSRLLNDITTPEHRKSAMRVRDLVSAHRDASDLIQIGAYVKGSDPRVDTAIAAMPAIERVIRQDFDEICPRAQSIATLQKVAPR